MKQRLFILTICLIATLKMMAQEFTLHGRVTDKDSHPIELATVSVASQGKGSLYLTEGRVQHAPSFCRQRDGQVLHDRIQEQMRVLRKPRGKQNLQVVLHTDAAMLGEVNVTGEKIQTDQTQEIKLKDARKPGTPSANSNAVEGIIQQQAGVSTHNELSSQYNVRGGAFDENSVYINNVEVYRPYLVRSGQQEGLSIINPYMVDKIGFSTGGYTAKYGDKMSSALDITYKTLRSKGKSPIVEGSVAASLLGADAYIGLGTPETVLAQQCEIQDYSLSARFDGNQGRIQAEPLDYQTYLSYQPNKRWKIDFIGNISDNHYNFEPSDRETAFGTMENVKNFEYISMVRRRIGFLTYFGTLGITRNITSNTSISLLGSAFYTKGTGKIRYPGTVLARPDRDLRKPRCRNILRACPQLSHGSCDECQADAEAQGTEA